MPSYGSLQSPSFSKMNALDSRRRVPRNNFSFANILGDPFALATISIAILAWLLAFIASVISDIKLKFPNFGWWAVVYMFFCILGVAIAVASDAIHTYHVAIVGFLAAGLVLTSSVVNNLVYSPDAGMEAVAAGHILLSMISIVWIFYFGSTPQATHRAYVDSFALHRDHHPSSRASQPMSHAFGNGRPDTSVSSNHAPQMYTSAQLSGFETASPVSAFPGGPVGGSSADQRSSSRFGIPQSSTPPSGTGANNEGDISAPTEYPYRAKAIYSYEANPEDANEISFSKHEILEVSDVSGRWWQAKKENGDTGIAPSNYLILL
ncbi:high osmolarity signaling protein SHO1 [Xylona heveae TC161]|uniref:High osmolarity signaling protein SHO1 n=1 Tax=Xylona heveae (strain CBS 132557 / TC161) TaxID=1328760 RepID=A0A165H652_XYLHT|nr:high osmolarity signaling protein SHO1 [Xylona heveae TC161]KZF23042.1 high osmolarity signaling protein SHO1 [Xylona heveae TC161]